MIRTDFLKDVHTWNSHLPLLWLGLEITKYNPFAVGEFGAGEGSTPYLRQYCSDAGREFISYDSHKEWAIQWEVVYVPDWNELIILNNYSVVLVDQSPEDERHKTMIKLKDRATIIVVHDAEPEATGYLLDKAWPHFKYRIYYKTEREWAAAVSNKIDLTKYSDVMIDKRFKLELL